MATGRCDACGAEEYMPFACKFCQGRFCASHRLPENHACRGLDEFRERARQEGRIMLPEGGVVRPELSAGAKLRSRMDTVFQRLEGRATFAILAIMAGVFLLARLILLPLGLEAAVVWGFLLDRFVYLKPWTLVTSVFTHLSFEHFFFNGLILFFFGPTIEQLLGTKRFAYLFLGGGVVAGLTQLAVFTYLLPALGSPLGAPFSQILGASGGIMALLGCLTILAPKMKVLLMFVIPVPLWAITAFYAALDLLGAFNPGSGVAHAAHLAGLGVGLWYGKKLQAQGLRVHMGPQRGVNYGRYF